MDRLEILEALIATADAGSFAAGGRRLGKSRDHVSKAIAEIEERLGLQLVHRTTRRTTLTEAGEAYVREIRPHLEGLRGADRKTFFDAHGVRGKLVIAAPLMWSVTVLAPIVASYMEAHPDVELDVRLSDEVAPTPAADVDVTLRLASIVDSDMSVVRLGGMRRGLFAAPAYLTKHGVPHQPDCLLRHPCLLYGNLATGSIWLLKNKRSVRRIPVMGRFSCNNGRLLADIATAGHGIVMLPDFLAAPYAASGRLVPVLPQWQPLPLTVHAMTAPAKSGSPRVRSFLNYVQRALSKRPVETA